MNNEQIAELLQAATAERDALVQEANQRVAYLNGRIQALRDILDGEVAGVVEEAVEEG